MARAAIIEAAGSAVVSFAGKMERVPKQRIGNRTTNEDIAARQSVLAALGIAEHIFAAPYRLF
jgi:hypothetical protein